MNVDCQKYYTMPYVDHTPSQQTTHQTLRLPDPENTDTQTSLERVHLPKPPARCILRTLPLG